MYAVIQTGGKQYRVQEGDQIAIEKLEAKVGDKVSLADVLAIQTDKELVVGKPKVDKASVEAEVVAQGKDRKVVVFKKKRRKGYKRTQGHRQLQTTVKILKIKTTKAAAKPEANADAEAKPEKKPAKKTAEKAG